MLILSLVRRVIKLSKHTLMMVEAQQSESIRAGPQHNARHVTFLAQTSVAHLAKISNGMKGNVSIIFSL